MIIARPGTTRDEETSHEGGRHQPARRRVDGSRHALARGPAAPPIVTVFRRIDGTICHSWCGHPLEFQGQRAGLELDFYCQHCVEHVPLPECVLSRIPVGAAARTSHEVSTPGRQR